MGVDVRLSTWDEAVSGGDECEGTGLARRSKACRMARRYATQEVNA